MRYELNCKLCSRAGGIRQERIDFVVDEAVVGEGAFEGLEGGYCHCIYVDGFTVEDAE
jgi:hypothetical protein